MGLWLWRDYFYKDKINKVFYEKRSDKLKKEKLKKNVGALSIIARRGNTHPLQGM
ncbi:hypothetical protein kam1_772 [Methylacidiphilum kamchatkense Kam1]|uniref:Uncharacterized protein n=1 Tax=Methylacidiphilum kamchatkense Kam1 TaxID=1202785 RepID=A0A516TLB6_9BACT|nr:hypothetical protein kam1_772 [Methylacidiphilum kamchatkense Kam1]